MNKKIKFYQNGKKKKEILDTIKYGRDFKLIITYDIKENIHNVMEKPNIKTWKQEDLKDFISGSHIFSNSEQNHIDFFKDGILTHKEYPNPKGITNYGYKISGGSLII
ncbi:MAG: hypothetical protein KKB62_03510 [Nanoarchaeota archaeon]|nr:hypothetical protein [Nanoarchaeota archaeon]